MSLNISGIYNKYIYILCIYYIYIYIFSAPNINNGQIIFLNFFQSYFTDEEFIPSALYSSIEGLIFVIL